MSYNETEKPCHRPEGIARYLCDVCGVGLCRICGGWWSGNGDARCDEHVDKDHCFPDSE